MYTPLFPYNLQLSDISMLPAEPLYWQLGGTVAKEDDAVASVPTEIRLFLDPDWLIGSSFQPQVQGTEWDSLSRDMSDSLQTLKHYIRHLHTITCSHTDTNIQICMLRRLIFFSPAVGKVDLLPVNESDGGEAGSENLMERERERCCPTG